MPMHKLLARQLNRLQLSPDNLPSNLENWQEFISKINKTYQEADQDRYLIERSMEISSREMQMLNDKLEQAQHIAGLGYWHYDANIDQAIWSKELFNIIEISPSKVAPTFEEFLQLVHPEQKAHLEKLMQEALNHKKNYEYELQIRNNNGNYRWYRIICHCLEEDGKLTGTMVDIHKDKVTEEKIQELNRQFIQSARRAGMSEVATSILHNIGNVLNSANVSINLLKDSLDKPYYNKLGQIIDKLKENAHQLASYLMEDEKGKLIPQYLTALTEMLLQEYENNKAEVSALDKDLSHIKSIVSMQQCLSGVPGVIEKVFMPEIIETALQLSINQKRDNIISIIKNRVQPLFIHTDKSKLLQILVNLLHNAKDAVSDQSVSYKEIELVVENKDNQVLIEVRDNGIGIHDDHLNKIFSFGFTTKEEGHGFGLHSSALSTQEMGGSLAVQSEGLGKGALFSLVLPFKWNTKTKWILQ